MLTHTRRRELSGLTKFFFALLGFLLMGVFDSTTDYPGGTPREKLLDSIYQAEGRAKANVPYGYHSEDFLNRTSNGEKVPVDEARKETAGYLERHIILWETNQTRNVVNARERGLVNPNPEKNKAIIGEEWNPSFLNWYGEIYAPTSVHPLNKFWLGNVRAGLDIHNKF